MAAVTPSPLQAGASSPALGLQPSPPSQAEPSGQPSAHGSEHLSVQVGLPPGQHTVISALQNIKEPREECFVMQSHSPWTDARVQHSHRRDMVAVGAVEVVVVVVGS